MDILLTFDNDYSQHAAVVMASFCSNNPGHHVFYIISDRIDDTNRRNLLATADSFDAKAEFFYIGTELINNFPLGKQTANTYVSLATYFRLFVLECLPSTIDKLLYLDCDVVVADDIQELWNKSFDEGTCLYALEERKDLVIDGCKRLSYPLKDSYFNAGILLFSLCQLRKHFELKEVPAFIDSHRVIFHDQDVLNGFLHAHKRFFELKYNVMDIHLIKHAILPERYRGSVDALQHPVVVHFSGPLKPWYKECQHPYRELYYKYLRETPWKNYIPVRKYAGYKERLIYHIKLSAKIILEALHLRYYSFIKVN